MVVDFSKVLFTSADATLPYEIFRPIVFSCLNIKLCLIFLFFFLCKCFRPIIYLQLLAHITCSVKFQYEHTSVVFPYVDNTGDVSR